ncbi:MAG: hypothetical protein COX20_02660 [Desulfobacterales bacterium CG23_combo_of_CG06-09_8_20_14_all_52_9]|nr:MAG: hypothetical protein COX20_02660 [Desulfobacterales bacterium CG23_combo_of_CG06-09_8_20_14_all_52_9]
MGPWDVMSSHLIQRDAPPPGLSSFTRIRLGWITEDQVILVKPGEEKQVTLVPLAKGGNPLVVKIPLKGSLYYLLENRQLIGYDRLIPDAGLLILRVDPEAMEGSGTVRIMDADPGSPRFAHATFLPDKGKRSCFLDKQNNIAVIPIKMQGEDLEIRVTTPERALQR